MTLSEFLSKAGNLFGAAEKVESIANGAPDAKQLTELKSEVQALKEANEKLQEELSSTKEELVKATKQRDEFKAIIDKPDGEIEKRAGLKAKEITAALGQPPLDVKPGTTGGADILAQFYAIKSPAARTEFYRKNKAAYDAAWAVANPETK